MEEIEAATMSDPEMSFSQALAAIEIVMKDKIAAVAVKAHVTLENLLSNCDVEPSPTIKSNLDYVTMQLMDNLGHNTTQVKQRAEELAFLLASHNIGGPEYMIQHLTRSSKEKKGNTGKKKEVGRLSLLNRIVQDLDLSPTDLNAAAEFAIQSYKKTDSVIRKEAEKTIMNLYQVMGKGLKSLLTDIRKPQMAILQEGFNEIDGVDPNKVSQAPPSEPEVVTNINPYGDKKKKRKPKKKEASPEQEQEDSPEQEEEPEQDEEQEKEGDPEKTCDYCGRFDENFDEDSLDMHMLRECAMLTECLQCGQTTEIMELNDHMLQNCDSRNCSECPNCKEAIASEEYDEHVEEESCNPAKDPQQAGRCPLCHQDIPPGEDGWKQHLLIDICPNNMKHP